LARSSLPPHNVFSNLQAAMLRLANNTPRSLPFFALVEGFHLCLALASLERLGILKSLESGVSVKRLAARHEVDFEVLKAALDFLAARTELVIRRRGQYYLTYRYDNHVRFLLFQYIGAYGRNVADLTKILRNPSSATGLIDRREHAKAFDQIATADADLLADIVLQLGLNHVLDLGCGTGTLLLRLGSARRDFIGWGLDNNPWMCTIARKRAATSTLKGRLKILQGDCRRLRSIPLKIIRRVRTITAANVCNEFFAGGNSLAVAWLKDVKAQFPGRTLVIADYCSVLGTLRPCHGDIALHDFAQVISGQGLPPSSLEGWKRIYRAARCHFIHAFEMRQTPYFVHVLRL
jgi:SAM-dependent methyltransferase